MKIRFCGTGAAEGFPAVFCSCENCEAIRGKTEEYRTRSQIIIDDCLSVDFPPEAYSNSLKYGYNLGELKYILVTHSHMDHFYAHDFILRCYKYARVSQPKLQIYGNAEVAAVYNECTRRELKPQIASDISVRTVAPYQRLKIGDYTVLTLPAQHSQTEQCLLYYIERNGKGYLHLYDTGNLDAAAFEFLAKNNLKAQVVAIDCTFADNSAGLQARHMGVEDDMIIRRRLEDCGTVDSNTKFVITHFSHNGNPTRARLAALEKKYSVIAAYDGMLLEI